MLKGLLKLTWVEIKIFLREPLGAIGTLAIPVVVFLVLGRTLRPEQGDSPGRSGFYQNGLPVVAVMLLAIGAVLSLIAIISIYREGGILKRLRATPLRPQTILTTHVVVKLLFSGLTLAALILAGRRFYTGHMEAGGLSFLLAILLVSISVLSIGFVIASVVPTARFAQPLGSVILYPLMGLAFVPLEGLPGYLKGLSLASPLTHAVQLLGGLWAGGSWADHGVNVAALLLTFVLCVGISSRIFRWE